MCCQVQMRPAMDINMFGCTNHNAGCETGTLKRNRIIHLLAASFGGNPASCLIQLRLRFESRERIAKNLEIPRTVRVREVGSNDQDLKARLVDKGLAHESPVVLAHIILETAHG